MPAAHAADTARTEIARVRGWSSRGEHQRAAEALDRALAALDRALAAATPAGSEELALLRADLDAIFRHTP